MRANLIAGIDIAAGVKALPGEKPLPFRRTGRAGGVDNADPVRGGAYYRVGDRLHASMAACCRARAGISSDPALASCWQMSTAGRWRQRRFSRAVREADPELKLERKPPHGQQDGQNHNKLSCAFRHRDSPLSPG